MAVFIARVELHGKSYDEEAYARLHEAMQKVGFLREIESGDGTWYKLPPAEYYMKSNDTFMQAVDKAETAAGSITSKNSCSTKRAQPRLNTA